MATRLFIPMRLASKRLPNKLLSVVNGKPMFEHAIRNLRASMPEHPITVSTCDFELVNAINQLDIESVVTHTSSQSVRNGTARVIEALPHDVSDDDIIVIVQADELFVHREWLVSMLHAVESGIADVATIVVPLLEVDRENRSVAKVVLYHNHIAIGTRKPIAAATHQHIGVYAYKARVLHDIKRFPDTPHMRAEGLEWLKVTECNHRIYAIESSLPHCKVDTLEDLIVARLLLDGEDRTSRFHQLRHSRSSEAENI